MEMTFPRIFLCLGPLPTPARDPARVETVGIMVDCGGLNLSGDVLRDAIALGVRGKFKSIFGHGVTEIYVHF